MYICRGVLIYFIKVYRKLNNMIGFTSEQCVFGALVIVFLFAAKPYQGVKFSALRYLRGTGQAKIP